MIEFSPTEWRSKCGTYRICTWRGKWWLTTHSDTDQQETTPATSYDDAAKQARDHRDKLTQEKP